jgi:hypothetical protein
MREVGFSKTRFEPLVVADSMVLGFKWLIQARGSPISHTVLRSLHHGLGPINVRMGRRVGAKEVHRSCVTVGISVPSFVVTKGMFFSYAVGLGSSLEPPAPPHLQAPISVFLTVPVVRIGPRGAASLRRHPRPYSQNSPLVGSLAKSFASWHKNTGMPERSSCFMRRRVSVIALTLQSHGIGTIAS